MRSTVTVTPPTTATRTSALLAELVDEGIACTGLQARASVGGTVVLDVALGTALPPLAMTTTTVHNVWCATKPIVALGAALLVEQGTLDVDEPLEERLVDHVGLRGSGIRLADVLNHSAGLVQPSALVLRTTPREQRHGLALTASPRRDGTRPVTAYSEYMGGEVVTALIESATGRRATSYLRERVLEPLGLRDTHFRLADGTYDEVRDRIGVYVAGLPVDRVPLLHDRVRSVAADASPALGGYTTMGDLHQWYAQLVEVLTGARRDGFPGPDTVAALLRRRRGHVHDPVLGRACDFAAGFMVDLHHHGFGRRISPAAVGHAGWLGTSWAWADPACGVAAAFLVNGMPTSADDITFLRGRVTDALYADLGLDHGST